MQLLGCVWEGWPWRSTLRTKSRLRILRDSGLQQPPQPQPQPHDPHRQGTCWKRIALVTDTIALLGRRRSAPPGDGQGRPMHHEHVTREHWASATVVCTTSADPASYARHDCGLATTPAGEPVFASADFVRDSGSTTTGSTCGLARTGRRTSSRCHRSEGSSRDGDGLEVRQRADPSALSSVAEATWTAS